MEARNERLPGRFGVAVAETFDTAFFWRMMMRPMSIFVAAALLTAPVQVLAQDDRNDSSAAGEQRGDDDEGNPRVGLLGLLGLAGLLGLMRREPDIHIDARRGKQP